MTTGGTARSSSPGSGGPHYRFELGLNDLDQSLGRRQAAGNFLAGRPQANPVNELHYHRQGHIGFAISARPHIAQRRAYLPFAEGGFTAQ